MSLTLVLVLLLWAAVLADGSSRLRAVSAVKRLDAQKLHESLKDTKSHAWVSAADDRGVTLLHWAAAAQRSPSDDRSAALPPPSSSSSSSAAAAAALSYYSAAISAPSAGPRTTQIERARAACIALLLAAGADPSAAATRVRALTPASELYSPFV